MSVASRSMDSFFYPLQTTKYIVHCNLFHFYTDFLEQFFFFHPGVWVFCFTFRFPYLCPWGSLICVSHTCSYVCMYMCPSEYARTHTHTHLHTPVNYMCLYSCFVFLVAPTESPSRTANLKEKMNLLYPWNFPFPCGWEVVGSGRWDSSPPLASILCIRWWMSVGQFPLHVK